MQNRRGFIASVMAMLAGATLPILPPADKDERELLDQIIRAGKILDAQNVSRDSRYLILDPDMKSLIHEMAEAAGLDVRDMCNCAIIENVNVRT